jgi:hypothetical protein
VRETERRFSVSEPVFFSSSNKRVIRNMSLSGLQCSARRAGAKTLSAQSQTIRPRVRICSPDLVSSSPADNRNTSVSSQCISPNSVCAIHSLEEGISPSSLRHTELQFLQRESLALAPPPPPPPPPPPQLSSSTESEDDEERVRRHSSLAAEGWNIL